MRPTPTARRKAQFLHPEPRAQRILSTEGGRRVSKWRETEAHRICVPDRYRDERGEGWRSPWELPQIVAGAIFVMGQREVRWTGGADGDVVAITGHDDEENVAVSQGAHCKVFRGAGVSSTCPPLAVRTLSVCVCFEYVYADEQESCLVRRPQRP